LPFGLIFGTHKEEQVMLRSALTSMVVFAIAITSAHGFEGKLGLKQGTPDLKSAGPLAFGPEGVLFVGDTAGAALFAIDTAAPAGDKSSVSANVKSIDEKIAALLGSSTKNTSINDMAVNPVDASVFFSVSRGRGPKATPVLLKLDAAGKLSEFSLKNVPFAKATLGNAPDAKQKGRRGRSKRAQSITDIAFMDGRVLVAGLSNEDFDSTLRAVPFPFSKAGTITSVEVFHGAHGRLETRSPVRTFLPFNVDGEPVVLAAYTCTPLVKFPITSLKSGSKLQGTTIAELGNQNRPLDMVAYEKEGRKFILMANSDRGVMKFETENIGKIKPVTKKVPRGEKAGLAYETIEGLKNVVQLDRLNKTNAVILVSANEIGRKKPTTGPLNLQTVPLP